MIISLGQAKTIDSAIEQEDLNGLEVSVRELTNNNFQNTNVRFKNIEFADESTVKSRGDVLGLTYKDTIEVNYSNFNDGLYTVKSVVGDSITFEDANFVEGDTGRAMVTKVEYPSDIKVGIKKLIAYDKKMGKKVGIKSESISRMSTTYYDMNSSENTDGYPSSLLSFIDKYEKMRW